MHLQPGTLLQGGKYKIVRFIAAGGFGCTYEATHTILKARVAIKEFFVSDLCNRDSATGHVSVGITSKVALFDKLRRKFVDEAAALFKLNHPGLVRVTDIFEENGTAYFVMDYIDGRSLADIVKAEGALSEARALGYIRQVCAALNYVHSNNRLHLDIKPNNIMVTGNDRAILIDFGASKQYDEASGENTSSLLGLTPGYAPPEQNDCDVKKFYPATDIYALGATLYDLLTGITPPSSNKRISEEEELKPLPLAISASTRTAVYAALELSKKKRPQSVAAFAALLDSAPAPAPTPKDDGETQLLVDKPVTPWYKRYTAVIAIAAVAAIAGCIALLSGGEPAVAPEPTPTPQPQFTVSGSINGHDYVDLGLSVKWATCNVGASSTTGYGDYYAWGEISTKSEYTNENSRTYENSNYDFNICGNSSYDVARYKWDSPWRLPSASEIQELVDNCTWEWTTMNGVSGYKVKSKRNSNCIFLPAAGYRYGVELIGVGECDHYWSGMPCASHSAYSLGCVPLTEPEIRGRDYMPRLYGMSVRPVAE